MEVILSMTVILLLIVAAVVFVIYIVTKSDGGLKLSERTEEEKNEICKEMAQKLRIFLITLLISAIVIYCISFMINHSVENILLRCFGK
jgi:ABC-type Fe3+ transport system permease subunit